MEAGNFLGPVPGRWNFLNGFISCRFPAFLCSFSCLIAHTQPCWYILALYNSAYHKIRVHYSRTSMNYNNSYLHALLLPHDEDERVGCEHKRDHRLPSSFALGLCNLALHLLFVCSNINVQRASHSIYIYSPWVSCSSFEE